MISFLLIGLRFARRSSSLCLATFEATFLTFRYMVGKEDQAIKFESIIRLSKIFIFLFMMSSLCDVWRLSSDQRFYPRVLGPARNFSLAGHRFSGDFWRFSGRFIITS